MPDPVSPRSSADVALAVLSRLRSHWDATPFPTQVAVAELLQRFWKDIAPREFDFQLPVRWEDAVTRFLAAVSDSQAVAPLVHNAQLADLETRPVTPAEQAALRSAVASFPAPGEPALPPRVFAQPAQALVAVVRELGIVWPLLEPREQIGVAVRHASLDAGLRLAATTEARDRAITAFLHSLEALPQAGAFLKESLDALGTPYRKAIDYVKTLGTYRDAGPVAKSVSEADARGAAIGPLGKAADLLETLVELHTAVEFPVEVAQQAEAVPLIVQLTLDAPEPSPLDAVRKLLLEFSDPAKPEEVAVVVMTTGFTERTGDWSRTIRVYSDRNSQPAVFLLQPAALGRHQVTVDFYHKDRFVGATRFETTVVERVQTQAGVTAPGSIAGLPAGQLKPPDLELRVITGADKRQLSFVLHSANPRVGYHWKSAGTVTLNAEPQAFLRSTFDSLSKMARSNQDERSPEEDRSHRRKLDGIGQNLYEALFSPELKQEYRDRIRRLAQAGEIRSLVITSDEPWIPWEIVKPAEIDQDTGQIVFDDGFLCQQFSLSRWLVGRGLPATLHIRSAQFVSHEADLAHVQRESDYFQRLGQSRNQIQVAPPIETADDVVEALAQGQAQLYHFACHGNFSYENPNDSVLRLKGGAFSPSDLALQQSAGVTRSRPLVFVNACHAGRTGFSLTGLGGWAQWFVGAGASAFIGGLWEVNDTLAADFAATFYNQLWSGQPLGEALLAARKTIRAKDEANPTWLAYVLYGDPNSVWTPAK